ncbi:MAG: ATP-binding protein [Elusimicrobia bacterium]|nr:ATP-binding protein [Elusimicrobiota bacterium]
MGKRHTDKGTGTKNPERPAAGPQPGLFPRSGRLRQAARQVLRAREEEKKRISNFLHDELGSLIMLLNSSLALARREALESGPEAAAARIEEAKKAARELAGALRRICFDIRPPAMEVSGLAGAVSELAARTERCTEVKVRCVLRLDGEKRLDGLAKIMAYRIVQEALNNAVKHSGARSVRIALNCAGGRLKLSVADDGRGFDADDPGFLNRHPALGLRIMREEAESLYASLSVESAPGFGTVVKGVFPPGPGRGRGAE